MKTVILKLGYAGGIEVPGCTETETIKEEHKKETKKLIDSLA
jgi:hypothetical protein